MSKLIVPTVHMNGTSKRDLLEQYVDAMQAIQEAIEALPHPHGRDYYVVSESELMEALLQRKAWQEKLSSIYNDLEQIAEKLNE